MRKLLFIIAVLLSFGVQAQTFTPIHNYQAPDGLDVAKFFGIPYGSNPTLNGVNRPNAHPLYYKTTDSSLYLYSGNQWIRVGGGNGNKDTVLVDEGLGVRFDSLGVQHIFAIHPDGYEGGIVTYTGTGFDFNVSPITLFLNNKVFLFPETTLTLSPPNSLPRYDIFGVDSLGAFVKSGDTSALPVEPQVGIDSFALTKAFLISPGDTAPSNITTVIIYDQNTEWTTGTQGSTSVVDFDNTDNPLHLTKDIFISKYNNNSKIYFVNGPYTSIENTYQSVLLLPIYLNSALAASNNIYIRLYDTLTASTNLYRLGSNDNFNKNEVNAYQTVVIPTSNLTWINNKSTFTSLLVTFSGYDTSGANGLYMDYVRLQKGLSQTGNGSCPLCIVDIHVTADSMYQVSIRQNGDTASLINWTGSGITDTSHLSDRINQKVNISDTASMLTPYLRKNAIAEGTNISFTGTGTDADPIVINASGGSGNDTAIVYYQLAADSSYALAVHSDRSIHLPSDTFRIIGTKLSGNGYVSMSGSTPSYTPIIPISGGGTNNNVLDVSVGNLFTGDGSKIIGLGHGNTNQSLRWGGSSYIWKDTTAAGILSWSRTGNTGFASPDTTSLYFGTNNNTPIIFKTNGTYRGELDSIGNFTVKRFKTNGQDSNMVMLMPGQNSYPSIQLYRAGVGTAYISNANAAVSFGTTVGGTNVALKAGAITSSNTSSSSSFKVTSGAQNFIVGGGTDVFLGLQRVGAADRGGFGFASANGDMQFRLNGALSITTGIQAARIFGTTQNVNIGSGITDVASSLFTVNSQPALESDGVSVGAGQYKVSIPAPKMTSSQRDSITTGVNSFSATAGAGYTNGNYNRLAFTGGTGAGFTGNVTVVGGVVYNFDYHDVTAAGGYYTVGDVLTASIPGGSGFSVTVTGLTSTVAGGVIYCTDCTATDGSTGVNQTWNGSAWKNWW